MRPALRRRLAAAGGVVVVAGLGAVATGAGPRLTTRLAARVVALLLLVPAGVVVRRRYLTDVTAVAFPQVESLPAVPRPGEDVDRLLSRVASRDAPEERSRLIARLGDVAADALVRFGGHTPAGARRTIAEGSWTADERVTALLTTADPSTADGALRGWLSSRVPWGGTGDPFRERVEATVDALAGVAGVDAEEPLVAPDLPEGPDPPPAEDLPLTRETNRWVGLRAGVLVALAVALWTSQPGPLLAVPVLAIAGTLASIAETTPPELTVERELSVSDPAPGEAVDVTLRVRNDGDALVSDLRIVDGVPPGLAVVEGSPRLGVALRPGKRAAIEYRVEARPGTHEFEPCRVVARDLSGSVERAAAVEDQTTIECRSPEWTSPRLPLDGRGSTFVGEVDTDEGGSGVEFYGIREFRDGDPLKRVDWKRLARTGELATVEFREERAATVQLVVDAREPAYRRPDADASEHAVDRCVAAAWRTYVSLTDAGNVVGLTAASPRSVWVQPGSGSEHRARTLAALAREPAFAAYPPADAFYSRPWLRELDSRLDAATQVIFFTPVVDDHAALLAEWIAGYGHPVTVVSPDPTADGTVGRRLARVERRVRLAGLRARGVRVIDWPWTGSLALSVAAARRRQQV